jgi:hypothetical protein
MGTSILKFQDITQLFIHCELTLKPKGSKRGKLETGQ